MYVLLCALLIAAAEVPTVYSVGNDVVQGEVVKVDSKTGRITVSVGRKQTVVVAGPKTEIFAGKQEGKLADVETGKQITAKLYRPGTASKIVVGECKVVRVVVLNPRRMRTGDIGVFASPIFRVVQVVGKGEMIVTAGSSDRLLWLNGIKTDDLADDDIFSANIPFKVLGTKQYTAVSGSLNTVYQLEAMEVPQDLQRKKRR